MGTYEEGKKFVLFRAKDGSVNWTTNNGQHIDINDVEALFYSDDTREMAKEWRKYNPNKP